MKQGTSLNSTMAQRFHCLQTLYSEKGINLRNKTMNVFRPTMRGFSFVLSLFARKSAQLPLPKPMTGALAILSVSGISLLAQIDVPADRAVNGPIAISAGGLKGEYWQRGVNTV